jgi:hypothetical protein
MAMREELPVGTSAPEGPANGADFLVLCGVTVLGFAASVGLAFASAKSTELTELFMRVLG